MEGNSIVSISSTGSQESSSTEMTPPTVEPRLFLTLKGPASLTVKVFVLFSLQFSYCWSLFEILSCVIRRGTFFLA